jgi:surface carbohydrate biosynthesis protein
MKYQIQYLSSSKKPVFVLGPDERRFFRDNFKDDTYHYFDPHEDFVYLNVTIVYWTLIYFIRLRTFKSAYLAGLVRATTTSLMITLIDNSVHFYRAARMLDGRLRVIAVQNGNRFDVVEQSKSCQDGIYIPEFACFGQNEVDLYQSLNAHIGEFHIVGSFMEMCFRQRSPVYQRSLHGQRQYLSDICIIAENFSGYDKKYPGIERATGTIAAFAQRYAHEYGLSISLALKKPIDMTFLYGTTECEFYGRFVDIDKVLLSSREENEWASYEITRQSRVTIGMVSTLLIETASRGDRVLICDFYGEPWSYYGADASLMLRNHDLSYEVFSEAMTNLLAATDQEYTLSRQKQINYYMKDCGTDTISSTLNDIIPMSEFMKPQF